MTFHIALTLSLFTPVEPVSKQQSQGKEDRVEVKRSKRLGLVEGLGLEVLELHLNCHPEMLCKYAHIPGYCQFYFYTHL